MTSHKERLNEAPLEPVSLCKSVTLASERIKLEPLSIKHQEDLQNAIQDGNLWELWFTSVPTVSNLTTYIETAQQEHTEQRSNPFAIVDRLSNKAIGSTRYCNLDHKNRRLEIGYSWYAKSYQRSYANTETKLLLLTYAFETLNCIAVEFRTNWHNHTSRTAISRLGAKQDAILRQHQIMPDGSYRDTVVFSILNSEWAAIKHGLQLKLKLHKL